MGSINWVIFDLGNVLLRVDQSKILETMVERSGCTEEEARRLLAAPAWRDLGYREFTPQEAYETFRAHMPPTLSQADFIAALNAELCEPIQGTIDILDELSGKCRTACLSNTNSIHWRELLNGYAFIHRFDQRYASQQMGCAKPEREIYDACVQGLRAAPNECLFFDDRLENVEGARTAGWNAEQFTSVEQLRLDLVRYGVLSA